MSSTELLDASVLMDGWSDRLRAIAATHWYVPTTMGPAVLSYARTRELLQDKRFRNMGTDIIDAQGVDDSVVRRQYQGFLLSCEGSRHKRLRGLLRCGFSRESVDRQRPRIRATAHGLLDRVADQPHFDFVSDVAARFPATVFAELLGIETIVEDPDYLRWCADMGHILGFEINDHLGPIRRAISGLSGYVVAAIEHRTRCPGPDMISALLDARVGDDRLSEDEIVSAGIALLLGGFDTTRRTLSRAILTMMGHRDQWHLLGRRPDLAASATEEILRYNPGTQVAIRVATESFDFHGLPVTEGQLVIAATGVANRDATVFDEPDRFDIQRPPAAILTFGAGPHHCLGAYLARTELVEALPVFAARLPDIELCGPVAYRRASAGSPGPTAIPVQSAALRSARQGVGSGFDVDPPHVQ